MTTKNSPENSAFVRHPFFVLAPAAFLIIMTLIISACSTKKNTFTRRVYHNLTAHYNAYWNGNESFKEGVADLEKNAIENYTTILPVFKTGTKQEAQAINPKMDRAIEKASKVIQRHSMYFNRKEQVRWIDDSYLLIGKSYLYKKEYSNARRTFEFITNRFSKEESRYDAEIWLAATHIQNGDFPKASSVLDNFRSSLIKGTAPSRLEKAYNMQYANFYVLQQKYEPAIKYLQRAIEITSRKKEKNRMRFILAQIYQNLGDYEEASRYYQLVIKKNPSYEMALNAKINLAKTYTAKSSNRNMIVKKLNKLLKDTKNEEYRDQIYYALAEIYLKDNDLQKGMELLALSVATSVSNDYQRSQSSLTLADLYFEKPNYTLAQAYYDTAMQSLPEDFPNYESLKEKTNTLTDLITNLQTIEEQDSLQRLAKMPEEQRNAIIDKIIKQIVEEEARLAKEESERQQSLSMLEQTNRQQNRQMQQGGSWYFYNTSAISFGFTEFTKKWGRRKLEDLWRLSNKQMVTDFGTEEEGGDLSQADSLSKDSTDIKITDPKKREYYAQDLPLTEEKLLESNLLIEEAHYNAGFIYKNGLNDNEKSIEIFEQLLGRFPETEHRLQVYYQLYKNYDEVPDPEKSAYYRDLIVRDFPDSDYAKIIIDPNYNLVLEAQRNAAKLLYESTYNAYTDKQFYMVINNYNEAIEKYHDSKLIPKFEFLKSLALGQIHNLDSLANSLDSLISKYPDSDVKPLAQAVLSRLVKDSNGQLVITDKPVGTIQPDSVAQVQPVVTNYLANPVIVHFFVAMIDGKKTNINALKIRLSDFNSKYYLTYQLKINSIVFKDDVQMVTVGNFENEEMAMNYYESVIRNSYVTSQIEDPENNLMIISVDNYPILYREKDLDSYRTFFIQNYLEK